MAPERDERPGATTPVPDDREHCPFCAGHEDRTPPERLRLGVGPTGWAVRVIPNRYPALERQEVVVHGPDHPRSLAELSDETLGLVAEAWQRRACDAGGICFPFVNDGVAAGASLPHSHSQLAWLPVPAPAAAAERGLPRLEPVVVRDGLTAGCPAVSRAAFELLIHPAETEPSWVASARLGDALRLVAALLRRLHEVRGAFVPANVWVHDGRADTGTPWHLEVLPRTSRLAALELGAGIFIDTISAEAAAALLRTAF